MVGIILTVLYFYGSLHIARIGWPVFMDYVQYYNLSKGYICFIAIWGIHSIGFFTMGTVFYFIYSSNHPFFERYKINNNPWPWNSDPEQWKILKRNSIYVIGVNNFFTIPISLLVTAVASPR